MVEDFQKGGTAGERTWRLIKSVIDVAEETDWEKNAENMDQVMLAAAFIEKGIRYNLPEYITKANMLAEKDGVYVGSYYSPMLYFKYGKYLTEKAKENMLSDFRISMAPGNWLRVTKQGYGNVNIPMKGAQNNILGGEALGKVGMYGEAFNYGMKLVRDLCAIVNDCGIIPEYNSPTYVAVTLVPLAAIANYAQNEEAVLRARLLQEIIFLDLCSRYHEPTNQIAGPYSREYLPRRLGGENLSKAVLYKMLPEGLYIGWKPIYQFSSIGEIKKATAADPLALVWVGISDFQYPDFMSNLALDKKYPYEIYMTSKNGGDHWDQDIDPGGRMDMSCYMTEEYSLASASREIMHGQSHGVVLFWRKKPQIQSMGDLKTMVWGYVSDEKKLGLPNKYAGIDWMYGFLDEGCFRTVQDRNKVIALYQMKKLGTEHSSLKLNCFIPLYDKLDELWIGDRKVESYPQYIRHRDTVFLKDGNMFMALRFLEAANMGREHEVVLRMIEDEPTHPKALAIASYNYQGQMRKFKPEEYDQVRNGFVLEVADTKEFSSFEAFRKHIADAEVEETFYSNGVWAVRYTSGGESLSIVYHAISHEIIERKINNKDVIIPMYSSPLVKEDRSGHIEIDNTSLDTSFGLPVWLMANEKQSVYMVLNLNNVTTPVKLKTPDGTLETDALPLGRIIYRSKDVKALELLSASGPVTVRFKADVEQPRVTLNMVAEPSQRVKTKGNGTWVYEHR